MLVDETGTQADFARKINRSPAQVWQLLAGRGIGDAMCEYLETTCGKPDGWLDQWLTDEGGTELVPTDLGVSPQDRAMLETFHHLPAELRAVIPGAWLSIVKAIQKAEKQAVKAFRRTKARASTTR